MADRDVKNDPGQLPADILAWWRRKGFKPHYHFRDLHSEEHELAFGAAKILRMDVLHVLREELTTAIAEGVPFEQFKRDIKPKFEALGFWAPQQVTDPETGQRVTIKPPARLATVYETNLRTARAQGQYERAQRNKGSRPYFMWQLGVAENHRPEHVALHGLVLPVDDPFWETCFPPSLWGCKCSVRTVSKREYSRLEEEGITVQGDPILDDDGNPTGHHRQRKIPIQTEPPKAPLKAWKNTRTGETEYTPEYVHPSFASNPATRRRTAIDEGLRADDD